MCVVCVWIQSSPNAHASYAGDGPLNDNIGASKSIIQGLVSRGGPSFSVDLFGVSC